MHLKAYVISLQLLILLAPRSWAGNNLVPLRVMTFNIEYGGTHVDLMSIISIIKKANPQVVALQEAGNNTDAICKLLNWPYYDRRLQLVSQLPLIYPPESKGTHTFVEIVPGGIVALSNVHLPSEQYGPHELLKGIEPKNVYKSECTIRLAALKPWLTTLPTLAQQKIPTFLAGDFNTPSHLDWQAADKKCKWPVSSAIARAGFLDSFRQVHADVAAQPGLTWWASRPQIEPWNPSADDPHDRIDFIYYCGPAQAISSTVITEADYTGSWPSDHRAVLSTFLVTPAPVPPLISTRQSLISVNEPLEIFLSAPGQQVYIAIFKKTGADYKLIEKKELRKSTQCHRESMSTSSWLPGSYKALLYDQGSHLLSATPFFIKKSAAEIFCQMKPAHFEKHKKIKVTCTDAPGNQFDSIGIYHEDSEPFEGTPLDFKYTKAAHKTSCKFDARGLKMTPGSYVLRYLIGDSYQTHFAIPFTVDSNNKMKLKIPDQQNQVPHGK